MIGHPEPAITWISLLEKYLKARHAVTDKFELMGNFSSASNKGKIPPTKSAYQEINLLWKEDEPADAKRFDRVLSQFISKIHQAYSAVALKNVEGQTIELYYYYERN